jgi:hypothetical protein
MAIFTFGCAVVAMAVMLFRSGAVVAMVIMLFVVVLLLISFWQCCICCYGVCVDATVGVVLVFLLLTLTWCFTIASVVAMASLLPLC